MEAGAPLKTTERYDNQRLEALQAAVERLEGCPELTPWHFCTDEFSSLTAAHNLTSAGGAAEPATSGSATEEEGVAVTAGASPLFDTLVRNATDERARQLPARRHGRHGDDLRRDLPALVRDAARAGPLPQDFGSWTWRSPRSPPAPARARGPTSRARAAASPTSPASTGRTV